MERIVVFGATGTAGGFTVRRCLDKGLQATAFTRGGGIEPAPNLVVRHGDTRDADDLRHAIEGQEAVVSALGPRYLDAPTALVSDWLSAIELDVRRVIVIGGAGILQADDTSRVHELPSYPPIFKHVNQDMLDVYPRLQEGELDWTMVCCPRILDSKATVEYLVADNKMPAGGGQSIEAENIGSFVARELFKAAHLRRRVGICSVA